MQYLSCSKIQNFYIHILFIKDYIKILTSIGSVSPVVFRTTLAQVPAVTITLKLPLSVSMETNGLQMSPMILWQSNSCPPLCTNNSYNIKNEKRLSCYIHVVFQNWNTSKVLVANDAFKTPPSASYIYQQSEESFNCWGYNAYSLPLQSIDHKAHYFDAVYIKSSLTFSSNC